MFFCLQKTIFFSFVTVYFEAYPRGFLTINLAKKKKENFLSSQENGLPLTFNKHYHLKSTNVEI